MNVLTLCGVLVVLMASFLEGCKADRRDPPPRVAYKMTVGSLGTGPEAYVIVYAKERATERYLYGIIAYSPHVVGGLCGTWREGTSSVGIGFVDLSVRGDKLTINGVCIPPPAEDGYVHVIGPDRKYYRTELLVKQFEEWWFTYSREENSLVLYDTKVWTKSVYPIMREHCWGKSGKSAKSGDTILIK